MQVTADQLIAGSGGLIAIAMLILISMILLPNNKEEE